MARGLPRGRGAAPAALTPSAARPVADGKPRRCPRPAAADSHRGTASGRPRRSDPPATPDGPRARPRAGVVGDRHRRRDHGRRAARKAVSGSTASAGLAQTASVLGSALLAIPLSRLMGARGRRAGLVAGFSLGAAGAALLVAAAVAGQFVLLCCAAVIFGAATAASLLARFAATDLAAPAGRGRVLSTVVWATTVGAVLGPNLLEPGRALASRIGLPPLTGPYLFATATLLAAAAVAMVGLRPDPLLEPRRLAPGADRVVPGPRLSPEPSTGRHPLRRAARAVAPRHSLCWPSLPWPRPTPSWSRSWS